MKKFTFKVQSFRRIPNPYLQTDAKETEVPQMFFAVCDVTSIPKNFPMETNPREQNLKTGVAKAIKESLKLEGERNFYLLNRGILLSAKSVTHDNSKSELTIIFDNEDVHGNVDGGHTYSIIKELADKITPGTQYVKLEILTGVEDIFTQLAAARNTSVQVNDQSIAELENRFEIIKSVLEKEPALFNEVKYKQNSRTGSIDISEILAILNLFNIDEYPTDKIDNHAIQSYSSKAKCIERYIKLHKEHDNQLTNPFVKMEPIILDILKLYNKLETKISDYYSDGSQNGRYGAVKGVSGVKGKQEFESKFYKQPMDFSTPIGFLYPILGAFRALVIEQNGRYTWKCDPFKMLDKVGNELVNTTIDRSRTLGNNANAVGKDSGNWKTLYMTVMMHSMM